MIYTKKQLDEAIDAAERQGWGHDTDVTGWGKRLDCMYRGYPVLRRIGTEVNQTIELVQPGPPIPGVTSWRTSRIQLAPWLVDELRALKSDSRQPTVRWHKDKVGDWLYGDPSGGTLRAVVIRKGDEWEAKVDRVREMCSGTEQQALDWASQKLDVLPPVLEMATGENPADAKLGVKSENPIRWRHNAFNGTWTYGDLAEVSKNGDGWHAKLQNGDGSVMLNEQDALNWVSRLAGVEAPRVEEKRSAPTNYQGIADRLTDVARAECAAGPWKAWPENSAPLGRLCLIMIKNHSVALAFCDTDGKWKHPLSTVEILGGVTHFAELNTEAP